MRRLVCSLLAIAGSALHPACGGQAGPEAPAASTSHLTLGRCASKTGAAFASAECGLLPVFENRSSKEGRRINIHVARWRAHAPAPAGAVLLLAGGPGSTGDGLARAVGDWLEPLRSTMDIVVVDQRGTGLSHSLFCAREVAGNPASSFGRIFDDKSLRACRTRLETAADLRQYTTEFAAGDLDDVRAALGYAQVSLYGGSYGSRLAQAYMRQFPTRTRSVVLDAVVPFDASAPLNYARTAQVALDRVIEDCSASPECRTAHPALAARFNQLINRFRAGPLPSFVRPRGQPPVQVRMSLGDFGYAVRGILYRAAGARELPAMITRAAGTGDVSEFAQRYWERSVDFNTTFSNGLHLSVLCGEDVAFIRPDDIGPATAGTFLGTYVIDEYRRACGLWPTAGISPEFRRPTISEVPTLLLSGYFDPVTPPEYADRAGQSLPASRRLVWRQGAHGSASACALPATLHVLGRGTLTDLPDVCR